MYRAAAIDVTHHDVRLARLPEALAGLRIVQVSDLHIGHWLGTNGLPEIASLTASLAPDLLVLTGDFVAFRAMRRFEAALPELAALRARLGVFACLGNHDHWEGVERVREGLGGIGVNVLIGDGAPVASGLWLAGVDDAMMTPADVAATVRGAPDGEAVVVLSHNPVVLPHAAHHPCLVLAGHTHGGQLALPRLGPERTARLPVIRLLVRAYESLGVVCRRGWLGAVSTHLYPAGWFAHGRARMYVSRGLGLNDAFPLRLNCPPEIACFALHPGGEETEGTQRGATR